MKLFFDENLSFKLANRLSEIFPESSHVRNVALKGASDSRIWKYCKEKDFIIVSKDTDFRDRSFIKEPPPKVIWLDVGNTGTEEIAALLRKECERIKKFKRNSQASILILSVGNY